MTSLPRLSLPPFSNTTFNNDAGILSKKHIFPKENSTIFGKILDVFSEQLKKRNVIDKHFVKCNYLEELVERDKLNYMIVSFYPQRVVYSVKEHNKEPCDVICRKHFSEEEELYSFMNNEEVPVHFLLLCETYGWDLFYDFHMIAKVEMFASVVQTIDPYISTFILLKPTSKVPSYFIGKENPMDVEERQSPEKDVKVISFPEEECVFNLEVKNKCESEVCFRLVPDLCLGGNQIQEFSTNVFASSSLNSHLIEQKDMPKPKKRRIMDKDEFLDSKKKESFLHPEHSEKEKEKEENEEEKKSIPFLYIDMRSKLKSLLESREMYLREKDYFCCHLIEVFSFEYISRKIKDCYKFEKDEINVYVENDCFYTFVKKCDSVVDQNEGRKLCCVSTRKNLDKFILAFATSVSKRFCKGVRISYKTHRDDNEVLFFFCADNGYDYEYELEDMCMRMKKMKALFMSEGEKFEKEADSKDKTDSVVFNDDHMDVLNSSHGDSPMEASEIGGEPVIPVFEEEPYLEKSEVENLPSDADKKTESCFSTESTSTREGESVSQETEERPYEEEKSKENLSTVTGKKSESSYAKRIIISREDLWSYGSFAFFPEPDTSRE